MHLKKRANEPGYGSLLKMDNKSISENNYKWIYTYDYAPDSVWDPWRETDVEPEWIANEADSVAERVKGGKLLTFALLSDSHFVYNGTWQDTVASLKAMSERVQFDGIIHLGDISDGLLPLEKTEEIEKRCIDDMSSLGYPVYLAPGNHDYNYFRGNPEVKYPENPRYFVDFEEHKIRLIFIDSFDPKESVRYGFTEECIHWLDSALGDMPEDMCAIIFSHVTPLVRLQAWAKDIRNRQQLIGVLDKYADKILAFVNGHNHCDHLFNDLNNGQFPIVSINCAKCECFLDHKPVGAVVPERALGEKIQESFDILQIDAAKGKMYFTRFGAGSDRYVENHKAYWKVKNMRIWAHRGCSQNYPENTLTSFEKAMNIKNLSGIELDIQLTKDGELVVIHDEKVDRTTDGIGFVRDFTLSELKTLHIRTGEERAEHIPTMREVLELLKPRLQSGLMLNIELKNGVYRYKGLEEKIVNLVMEYGVQDSVIYSSFYPNSLINVYKLDPGVKLGVLNSSLSNCLFMAKGIEDILGIEKGSIALHPCGGDLDITPDMLEGRTVRAWFGGHLYPSKPTGGRMDFERFEKTGVTDVFINEPENYIS